MTLNLNLAAEWYPSKNDDLLPSNVRLNYSEKVLWICPQGHDSYQSTPEHRIDGDGCPICAKIKIG